MSSTYAQIQSAASDRASYGKNPDVQDYVVTLCAQIDTLKAELAKLKQVVEGDCA